MLLHETNPLPVTHALPGIKERDRQIELKVKLLTCNDVSVAVFSSVVWKLCYFTFVL